MVAVVGAARGPGDLAKHVMVPEAAERGRVPLERATGLSGVTERLSSTLGLPAGGILVALLGPLTGLVVNAVCFALAALLVALALPRGMGRPAPPGSPGRPREAPPGGEPGYWRRLGEGFVFLRGEPLLLAVIVMVGVTNLLDAALNTVLLPVWAERSGNGPAAIGLSNGVLGAAAIAGSLLAAGAAHRLPRRAVFFTGFLLVGAPRFLVLAADVPMWAVVAVFAVGGSGPASSTRSWARSRSSGCRAPCWGGSTGWATRWRGPASPSAGWPPGRRWPPSASPRRCWPAARPTS